jgi:hypothetical protein
VTLGGGVTADTPVNLAIGAGIVKRNSATFGASMDNNHFGVVRTMFVPELNGQMGNLKGTDYIQKSMGQIQTTIPEVGADVVAAGIPGAVVDDTTTPGETTISDATDRRLADTAYADWELDLERQGGGTFAFRVFDAINTAGFESDLQDAGVFAPRYTLEGRRDAATPAVSDWQIGIVAAGSGS